MTIAFPPSVAELLAVEQPNELGPGQPNSAAKERLARLDDAALFGARSVIDRAMALCCHAGLWLMHDYFDESHAISQEVHTPTGSFWHGILHRREPDYGNAKYWFRRVGDHAIFPDVLIATRTIAAENKPLTDLQSLANRAAWDPCRFVDLCEQAASGQRELAVVCRAIAAAECRRLFEHCWEASISAKR